MEECHEMWKRETTGEIFAVYGKSETQVYVHSTLLSKSFLVNREFFEFLCDPFKITLPPIGSKWVRFGGHPDIYEIVRHEKEDIVVFRELGCKREIEDNLKWWYVTFEKFDREKHRYTWSWHYALAIQ